MTPETTRDLVPVYVLGELKGEERVAFEMALHRSAELRRAVYDCSEAFADVAAAASNGCEASHRGWKQIEQQIAPATKDQPTLPSRTDAGRGRTGLHWAWPVAAAFLLGLNLMQWSMRRDPVDIPVETAPPAIAAPAATTGSSETGANERASDAGAVGDEVAGSRTIAGTEEPIEEQLTPGGLEAENRRLSRENRRLVAENADLREIVVPLVRAGLQADLIESGGVALWMAELRSQVGDGLVPQRGLWGRIRELVPEAGVALVPDRFRFAPPVDGGVGVSSGPDSANTFNGVGDAPPPPAAFALAVINAEEGLGYLDLYNLPVLPAGREMRLWVQREGHTDFTAIGLVPDVLSGGSGGLAFRVEVGTGRPSRVMITIEPADSSPVQPAGPVVIEGP